MSEKSLPNQNRLVNPFDLEPIFKAMHERPLPPEVEIHYESGDWIVTLGAEIEPSEKPTWDCDGHLAYPSGIRIIKVEPSPALMKQIQDEVDALAEHGDFDEQFLEAAAQQFEAAQDAKADRKMEEERG